MNTLQALQAKKLGHWQLSDIPIQPLHLEGTDAVKLKTQGETRRTSITPEKKGR